MVRFPPELVEWIPAMAGLFVAGCGWALIFYTRYTRHVARLRKKDRGAE